MLSEQCLKFPGSNLSSYSLESCILAGERLLYNPPSIILCDHCLYCLLYGTVLKIAPSLLWYIPASNCSIFCILQIDCIVLLYGNSFNNLDEILIVVLVYGEIYSTWKSDYILVCHSTCFSNCFIVFFFCSFHLMWIHEFMSTFHLKIFSVFFCCSNIGESFFSSTSKKISKYIYIFTSHLKLHHTRDEFL